MISYLEGQIHLIRDSALIVLVNGVGYRVNVPAGVITTVRLGDHVALYTYQYVREDALDLYGFQSVDGLELFEQLISVSGIGPKAGLALLSQFSSDQIRQSIMGSDIELLTKVPGIGKKTAERLVLELKGTLEDVVAAENIQQPATTEALRALEQLGYTTQEAMDALREVDNEGSTEEQIKQALGFLLR